MRSNLISLIFLIQFISYPLLAQLTVDCSQLSERIEKFNGTEYTKYNVVDSAFMKCPQVREKQKPMPWIVKKTEWTSQDEINPMTFE